MLRILFGIAIGVYLAQNYHVPDSKNILNGLLQQLRDLEKTLSKKDK